MRKMGQGGLVNSAYGTAEGRAISNEHARGWTGAPHPAPQRFGSGHAQCLPRPPCTRRGAGRAEGTGREGLRKPRAATPPGPPREEGGRGMGRAPGARWRPALVISGPIELLRGRVRPRHGPRALEAEAARGRLAGPAGPNPGMLEALGCRYTTPTKKEGRQATGRPTPARRKLSEALRPAHQPIRCVGSGKGRLAHPSAPPSARTCVWGALAEASERGGL